MVIFTHLISRIPPRTPTATQTLILAHRRELVEQAARHCAAAYPNQTIELELGKLHASGRADITVASLQSILSKDRFKKFDPERIKLVLVDEAHHIVAPGYLKVLEHLGLRHKQDDSPHLVGVSATFSRFDGLRLGAVIDEIVYHKDYVDMIGEKWLSDVVFTTVESKADLSKVKRRGKGGSGEFDTESLSRAVNTVELNDIVVRAWMAKAQSQGRKSTLVFCVDLNHVVSLTQRFRYYGIDARFVTGDTPNRERAERLDAFKNGEFPVLVNCGVFTEGTDIPNIDCIVLARPTRSRNLLIQMIGRGMRLHDGKKNCHIIDMVSGLETGIVTTPTLFGLDPDEIVEEATASKMYELRDRRQAEKAREAALQAQQKVPLPSGRSYDVTFTEYDSIFDLIADTSGEQHIRSISPHSWVQVSPHKFILSGPGGTYIRLERLEEAEESSKKNHSEPAEPKIVYKAYEVRALPPGVAKSPYATPRHILTAETFPDAVHGADNYASHHYPYIAIATKASWRSQPASQAQLDFLNKFRPANDKLGPEDVSKGRATDMITKIRHGAKGQFAKIEALKKKKQKNMLAEEMYRQRRMQEMVRVGPLPS
ncbi:helicase-like protein [Thermochaetoides thermophila DSM 1495]|uniref:Helicase-like protein n=1 Tax=Chaetomium thermophilum (strain DSM 1495 / CBS 144.50 / IMI 039719) TaxID=759272 RepID=G0S854_CHATD|nr:helicase-like protein [Thermochaetoides thermophila DSM 1495]EGS21101.1 helicase-like protein [Thermochaetoides thermophila DSM 1495]